MLPKSGSVLDKGLKKQEVLEYLKERIEYNKGMVEFTRNQPYQIQHDAIIKDWKDEIRVLLYTLNIVLDSK